MPAIAYRVLIGILDLRWLSVDEQGPRRAALGKLWVVGDIFPEISKILAGKGVSVRPLVPLAQVQRENPVVGNLVTLQDIRLQFKIRRITDQARIAIDDHLPNILLLTHQQAQLAALLSWCHIAAEAHQFGFLRNSLLDRRQLAGLHFFQQ